MSTGQGSQPVFTWSSTQVYGFALVCLIVGSAIGYTFAGSASMQAAQPVIQQQQATPGQASPTGPRAGMGQQVSPQELKHMADMQAEPLLSQLKRTPNDADLLYRVGNIYYDAQQYPAAIEYYQKGLQVRPSDANMRTDMATAYWYLRDVDRALAEFDKSLRYSPSHPGTLLNKGVVLWQGKNDTQGAVACWQKLLALNPGYPERQKITGLIARAKEHAGRGAAPRS